MPIQVETKSNKKMLKFGVVLMALGLLGIICFGGFGIYTYHQKFKDGNIINQEQTIKINSLEALLLKAGFDLKEIQDELTTSKDRIAGIKDKDGLLKRDIGLYIQASYRKIPRTVAIAIAENVVDISKKEGISPELVIGIIEIESSFNPSALGIKTKYGHARGLMQVMPEWAPKLGIKSKFDLHDIDTNITAGIKVFKIHLEEGKGNISKGLYLYVNKSSEYVGKVYTAMGKFVSFRSTVDDDSKSLEIASNTKPAINTIIYNMR